MHLEESHKVLRIVEPEVLSHLAYAQIRIAQHLFGGSKDMVGDEVLGRSASLCLDQIAKISSVKILCENPCFLDNPQRLLEEARRSVESRVLVTVGERQRNPR